MVLKMSVYRRYCRKSGKRLCSVILSYHRFVKSKYAIGVFEKILSMQTETVARKDSEPDFCRYQYNIRSD